MSFPRFQSYVCRTSAACILLAAAAWAQSDFTIVALPDTQYYAKSYPAIFNTQMTWIAQNQAAQNIQLVVGLGDIVDGVISGQLAVADNAYKILDAGNMPYFAAIGNHDYSYGTPGVTTFRRNASAWNQYFGPARYANKLYYKGNFKGSNENFWGTISLGGRQYLILALEFYPRSSVLSWAGQVLQQNSTLPAIIVTHSFLYSNARISTCDNYTREPYGLADGNDGEQMWQKLVSQHANVQLVLSGHVVDYNGVGRSADVGVNGNLVNQILSDYQNYANGGNGYLRIMNFHPAQNRVDVTTYSPYAGTFLTDAANQFSFPITSQPSTLTTGTIQGRVSNMDNCTRLAGTTISNGVVSTVTDQYGNFTLGVGPGTNTITVSKSGYLSQSKQIAVHGGYPYMVKFALAVSQ